jgi:hypothetical protein
MDFTISGPSMTGDKNIKRERRGAARLAREVVSYGCARINLPVDRPWQTLLDTHEVQTLWRLLRLSSEEQLIAYLRSHGGVSKLCASYGCVVEIGQSSADPREALPSISLVLRPFARNGGS